MKLHKIISTNRADTRREIIAEDDDGRLYTKYIHKKASGWIYFKNYNKEGKPVFGYLK